MERLELVALMRKGALSEQCLEILKEEFQALREQIIVNFNGLPPSDKTLSEHLIEQRALLLAIDTIEAVLIFNSTTAKQLAEEED